MEYKLFYYTEHFCVWYKKEDKDIAYSYKEIIENKYNFICNKFKFPFNLQATKIHLYICRDIKDFILLANKKKEEYQDWMVGNTDFSLKRICLLSPKSCKTHSEKELEKVVIHEIIHILCDTYWGFLNTEAWVTEGIALLYANQINLQYINLDSYPKISELIGDKFIDNGGYIYSGIYVWYFIKQFGIDKFIDLYKNKINVFTFLDESFEKNAIMELLKVNEKSNNI